MVSRFRDFSGMTRAPVVIGGVIMVGHINDRTRFDGQVTVLQESGLFFPGEDLNIAADIHDPAPGAIA
jgi:hypothetical protein